MGAGLVDDGRDASDACGVHDGLGRVHGVQDVGVDGDVFAFWPF